MLLLGVAYSANTKKVNTRETTPKGGAASAMALGHTKFLSFTLCVSFVGNLRSASPYFSCNKLNITVQ